MPAPTFDRRSFRRPCAVLVAALSVVFSGCAPVDNKNSTERPVSVFESAPCPSPNYPGHPELDLGSEFSCGFLSVPENRANPDGRKIKIAVARPRAQLPNARPDPLVYLIGGPGGSAVASAVTLTGFGLNRDRDVIFIDQRGTLHSDPFLSCPEIDQFMADSAGMSVQSQSTADKDLDAVRACRTRLASDGYDLSAYNTTENAADIADWRHTSGVHSQFH